MNNRYYYIDLFELYKNLLTPRQIEIFKLYFFDDLTLREISDNLKISRSGINKTIKNIQVKLEGYEEKLKLKEKNNV